MKLLLDSCVWGGAVAELEAAGHDVIWAGSWPSDPGDDQILAIAFAESRVLITLDKDFGELAVLHGVRHAGILRLVDIAAKRQAAVSLLVLELHAADLEHGGLITAEPGRIRIRRGVQDN
jgi:predicted nuclease of predicted toxin-antitoxin system